MKKLLLTLLLVGSLLGVSAQKEGAYADNTFFLSMNVGGAYYHHEGSGTLGVPSAGVYLGRWLMRPLAFRIAGDMAMIPANSEAGTDGGMFVMGSAQFMWDINSTFFHVYNRNYQYPIPFYPMIGLGVLYKTEGPDRDFQGMLGAHIPFRIGELWDAALEYKCFFLPAHFDGSMTRSSLLHTVGIGLSRRWSDDPYHRRTAFESRNTGEDWFTGFGVGALFNSFEFEHVLTPGSKLWNITGDMMVGRNWSNIWTIRFELSGFFGRGRYVNNKPGLWYTFNSLHTDFMINLSNLANFRRGRKWSFLPYLGAGPVWRYKHPVFSLGADGGLMVRRYVDNMGDFFVDFKYIMVTPYFAGGTGPSGSYLGVGYPMVTVGYICNWGHSTTRYRMPVNSCVD